MDATGFFGLERTDDPRAWRMKVVPELCSGMGALFGGCGLGAAIEALEVTTGRPLVWATAQYLSFARPPSVIDLGIIEAVRGHQVSQARAVASDDGEEILTVNAALGQRELRWSGAWAVRPQVPPPAECRPRELQGRHQGSIMSRLDTRGAHARDFEELDGEPGDGRSALWVHLPDLDMSAAALAIVGDYVPFGIGQALGRRTRSNSLDNTLRMVQARPTEWVLADIRVQAVSDGFGHGVVHLWSEDGTLLASASQSTTVREWVDESEAPR